MVENGIYCKGVKAKEEISQVFEDVYGKMMTPYCERSLEGALSGLDDDMKT